MNQSGFWLLVVDWEVDRTRQVRQVQQEWQV
jgi:hypothetical protein